MCFAPYVQTFDSHVVLSWACTRLVRATRSRLSTTFVHSSRTRYLARLPPSFPRGRDLRTIIGLNDHPFDRTFRGPIGALKHLIDPLIVDRRSYDRVTIRSRNDDDYDNQVNLNVWNCAQQSRRSAQVIISPLSLTRSGEGESLIVRVSRAITGNANRKHWKYFILEFICGGNQRARS